MVVVCISVFTPHCLDSNLYTVVLLPKYIKGSHMREKRLYQLRLLAATFHRTEVKNGSWFDWRLYVVN